MTTRMLSIGYVKEASLSNYSLSGEYNLISAKDSSVIPDEKLLKSGVDMGLMRLHICNAPERRTLLGLRADRKYEVLVSMSPTHIHGRNDKSSGEIIKVKYHKLFDVEKDQSAGGFTYKAMFTNLVLKNFLSINVELTEVDNEVVDPNSLANLLKDTGVGEVLDLGPYNPKEYLMLASNIANRIQDVFGSDKVGDDPLWSEPLALHPKPTVPGSYRLSTGFYAIIESEDQVDFSKIMYTKNTLINKDNSKEIKSNYLIFGVGVST
ncbi:hypothetical protein [Shewanella salipaludis]|uniref:Uncharacterized protein n=1 Tax=Shewanella salipaludis TaxID=2723052 RepID=A0A972FR67_9GAMM|nr:hypothetical protein [Shewanella salipaludis]NMH63769.1 hypothetical protein [Shewanella salipaludis]